MTPGYVEKIAEFVLTAMFSLLVAIGILLNVFIVIVKVKSWKKSQRLQTIDIILTSLAMLRILLLSLYILVTIYNLYGLAIFPIDTHPEFTITLTIALEFCGLWWGSVLSVFYCAKITNYSNRLFTRLKRNISKMVPWLLLISVVPSIGFSLPYKWVVMSFRNFNGTGGQPRVPTFNWINFLILRLTGSVLPFVLSCISIGLLIVSLRRHSRHLASRGSGFSDAQRDIHLRVIQNMISFLLFCILYFVGSNLFPVSVIFKQPSLTILCFTTCVIFPSIHSISLVVSNRELNNAILTVLRCSWMRGRKTQMS
ncbi:taste receptor type 2 member 7-like [Leptodactylus fuscus]|uniref:taste receptor type 2 member 7-like n=1 Tax=Leptodactylus fuscus TaxID=238119 RepID=UPI003F4EDC2E